MSLLINTFRLLSTSALSRRVPFAEFCRRSALLLLLLIRELVELSATADALIRATPAVKETRVSVKPKPALTSEAGWRFCLGKFAHSLSVQRIMSSIDPILIVNSPASVDIWLIYMYGWF